MFIRASLSLHLFLPAAAAAAVLCSRRCKYMHLQRYWTRCQERQANSRKLRDKQEGTWLFSRSRKDRQDTLHDDDHSRCKWSTSSKLMCIRSTHYYGLWITPANRYLQRCSNQRKRKFEVLGWKGTSDGVEIHAAQELLLPPPQALIILFFYTPSAISNATANR